MYYDLPILVYHKIDSRMELGINSISPEKFEKQISLLKNKGYKSISPCFLETKPCDFICTGIPDKPVLITFDDGYEGVYNFAYPVLRKYGFEAIIFLTTGYIGKENHWEASPGPRFSHLNWSQIREMAEDNFLFGSHGVNHLFLARQSYKSVSYELEASKDQLENGLGKPINLFSYPYGNYDNEVANLVLKTGYKAAFSLRPDILKLKHTEKNGLVINNYTSGYEYMLPRIAIYSIDSVRTFNTKVGQNQNFLFHIQKVKNRFINKCSYASILVRRHKNSEVELTEN